MRTIFNGDSSRNRLIVKKYNGVEHLDLLKKKRGCFYCVSNTDRHHGHGRVGRCRNVPYLKYPYVRSEAV